MGVTLSGQITNLVRQIALDQIAQDIKNNATFLPLTGGNVSGKIFSSANNSIELTTSSGDAYAASAIRSDTNVKVSFGIGSGGINRGIYDKTFNKWMVYFDNDGVLKTGQDNVLTSAGGDVNGKLYLNELLYLLGGLGYDNRFQFHKATDTGTVYFESYRDGKAGPRIVFRDITSESFPGDLELEAKDGTSSSTLRLKPTGQAYFGGKSLALVSSESIGQNGHFLLANGFQLCWGTTGTGDGWVNYPLPFDGKPRVVTTHQMGSSSGGTGSTGVYLESSTRFYFKDSVGASASSGYIAIGKGVI